MKSLLPALIAALLPSALVAGAISLSAPDNSFNPSVDLAPNIPGQVAHLIPGGGNQPGVALTGTGTDTSMALVHMINKSPGPYAANSVRGSITLRMWGWKAGDTGIEIWGGGSAASGTFANPAPSVAGDAMGKVSFFGYTPGGWAGNESVRIDARADENFTTGANGGSLWIDTTQAGGLAEITRWGLDSKGNMALGAWPKGGNNFPVSGGFVLKDTAQAPSAGIAGAGILTSIGSLPWWTEQSGGTRRMVQQWGAITPGQPVCWIGDGFVGACP